MRQISVICNNRQEWHHFKNNLEWTLSQDNSPYKSTQEFITDYNNEIQYLCFIDTPFSVIPKDSIRASRFLLSQKKLYPKLGLIKRILRTFFKD